MLAWPLVRSKACGLVYCNVYSRYLTGGIKNRLIVDSKASAGSVIVALSDPNSYKKAHKNIVDSVALPSETVVEGPREKIIASKVRVGWALLASYPIYCQTTILNQNTIKIESFKNPLVDFETTWIVTPKEGGCSIDLSYEYDIKPKTVKKLLTGHEGLVNQFAKNVGMGVGQRIRNEEILQQNLKAMKQKFTFQK